MELIQLFEQKGIPTKETQGTSDQLMRSPSAALETHAREQQGIDPEDLGGSAWSTAITWFVLFAIGGIVLVLPLLIW